MQNCARWEKVPNFIIDICHLKLFHQLFLILQIRANALL